ncbi:hypothetical protein FRB97_005246 [Tulasnella sp. 331]|nr:hypothetical protein FRB97_005246 [Tulasnella sp. 331]
MTNFSAANACSPTRLILHGGMDNHLAGLGQMAPWATGFEPHQTFPDNYGFTPLNPDGTPAIRFLPALYTEDDKLNPNNQLPEDHFSSRTFVDELIGFFDEAKEEKDDRQWLASLNFTAPVSDLDGPSQFRQLARVVEHWPLQADPKVIAKYKGLIPKNAYENPHLKTSEFLPYASKGWGQVTSGEKGYSSRLMEMYAAMVDQMDEQIGRLINYLTLSGELDNTFVLFMSDHGAESGLHGAIPILGDGAMASDPARYLNAVY